MQCILCKPVIPEQIIVSNSLFRVISVENDYYPGYLQLITNQHIKELSDLSQSQAVLIFEAIFNIEKSLRLLFKPDKINIASLGNLVAHLHWHIIPRYKNDRHFPNSIWGDVTNSNYVASLDVRKITLELIQDSVKHLL